MPLPKYALVTLLAASLFFLTLPITAQTSADTSGWEPDTIAWDLDLADIVVTAQYAPTATEAAVHQVQVIKAEQWMERGQNTLDEVLLQTVNLGISPDPILGSGLRMQGLGGQQVQIMIDGVPVVGRLGGNIDVSQLNLSQFARVEIVLGNMSAQYGSNAAGGVINLITKQHHLNKWNIDADAQVESIGVRNGSLRLGRKLGNAWQVDGGVNRYIADFAPIDSMRLREKIEVAPGEFIEQRVIPWNPKYRWSYDANLSFRPTDSLRVRYGVRSFNEVLSLYGPPKRLIFQPYAIDQHFTTQRQDHSLQAEVWLGPHIHWQTTAGLNVFDRFKATDRYHFEQDSISQEPNGTDTTRYTGQLFRSSWSVLGKNKLDYQLGVEYFGETAKGQRILETATLDREPAMQNYAAWLNLRYHPHKNLTLEANARYGHNTRYRHPLVPSVNVLWQPTSEQQVRLSYARGFRAPSLQELFFNFIDTNHDIVGNANLAAENAHNVRLQWQGELTSRQSVWQLNAALFYNQLYNRITLLDREDGGLTYGNLTNYETHGINLGYTWTWRKHFRMQFGLALTQLYNSFNEEFAEADPFVLLSEANLNVRFHWPRTRLVFQTNSRYFGRQDRYAYNFTTEALEQSFVEEYLLQDFTVQRPFGDGRLLLTAGIKNIWDRERAAIIGSNSGGGTHSGGVGNRLIGFGRSYFLRMGVRI